MKVSVRVGYLKGSVTWVVRKSMNSTCTLKRSPMPRKMAVPDLGGVDFQNLLNFLERSRKQKKDKIYTRT